MIVTNNSRAPLGIPGYGMLEPNSSKNVAESVKDNNVVAAWFKAGMLVEDSEPAKPAAREEHSDDDEKDTLIAELADKGIQKSRRSTVKTLREALDNAE
jgi:hypothetical protein